MIEQIEISDQELFNRIAEKYSKKDYFPASRIARKFIIKSIIKEINKYQPNIKNILEIGCGIGATTAYLDNSDINYHGLDYSSELIKLAQESHSNKHTFYNLNLKEFERPVESRYDLIMGVGLLHHVVDIDSVMQKIGSFGNKETYYCFVEPFAGNPIIELMRQIRKRIDPDYSSDQQTFTRKSFVDLFARNGFNILRDKNKGYFSTPFSQIILKPNLLSYPLSWISIKVDSLLQKIFPNCFLSWNIYLVAQYVEEK